MTSLDLMTSSGNDGKAMLTAEYLKTVLRYEPGSGLFFWINTPRRGFVGKTAGCRTPLGYVIIRLVDKGWHASRLAFLYMTGEWPPNEVDHINGIKHDNRWENLRDATRSQNMQNQWRPHRTSRMLGVHWHKRAQKWRAQIQIEKKRITIGDFHTAEEAQQAYLSTKRQLHPYGEIAKGSANG